jgi:hypothetical protein
MRHSTGVTAWRACLHRRGVVAIFKRTSRPLTRRLGRPAAASGRGKTNRCQGAVTVMSQDEDMVDYDLDRMGWQQFEQMVQSLALAELGNGVRSFGSGTDGGREATFRGKVSFPQGGGGLWDGYGVIQAKHLERPASTTSGWRKFLTQVKEELEKWVARKTSGTPKASPQYFIFATNVTLTGTTQVGGIDQFDALLESFRERLQLKGWFAWDYSQLRALLDNNPSVRQTYLEQIVVGDFLSELELLLPKKAAETGRALAVRAAQELTSKQWVRIGDAGYGDGSKLPLSAIGIDLPATRRRDENGLSVSEPEPVGRHVIEVANAVGRPGSEGPRGLVIVGGPGQGKSTLAQLVAHVYRVEFLESTNPITLAPRADEAVISMRDRLREVGFPAPKRKRYPIVIDLAKFGAYLSSGVEAKSLLGFMSLDIISGGKSVDPGDLLLWLKSWPCCLILDGLDEVPSTRARSKVIQSISEFVVEASSEDVDLFVLATTRPQGYRGEFDEALHTETFELSFFDEAQALSYAEALISARGGDDPDLNERVTERLIYAVHQRLTQRLMTTPLQVTIMTALAERAVDLPTTRFELFDAYYRTIYDREVGKADEFRSLRKLRSHIDYLHEQAGLLLQKKAESATGSDALLSQTEVTRLLIKRLEESGFEDERSKATTAELLKLAAERLVLLVSPEARSFGFEVRSIQEYMAARALTEGTDQAVLERLRTILPSSYWRNVWLLAAGRIFERKEHLVNQVLEGLEQVDRETPDSELTLPGADLAIDLYLDGVAAEFPALRTALLKQGLTRLRDTSGGMSGNMVQLVSLVQDEGATFETTFEEMLESTSALSSSNDATRFLSQYRHMRDGVGLLAQRVLSRGRAYIKPELRDARSRALILARFLNSSQAPSTDRLGDLVTHLSQMAKSGAAREEHVQIGLGAISSTFLSTLLDDLAEPAARQDLATALRRLGPREPDVAQFGTDLLRSRESSLPRATLLP